MGADEAGLAAERAYALVEMNRPREAVALLRRALAGEPDDIRLWCNLARAHLRAGELPYALGAADRALAVGPALGDAGWPHRLRASALHGLGRLPEAAGAAREAVRLDPYSWQSHLALVDVLLARPDLALPSDEIRPSGPGAGRAWEQLRRTRAGTKVLEAALRAAALAPDEPAVLVCLARAQANRGETSAALEAVDRALAVDPQHEQAHLLRALLLRNRGRYASAAKGFLRAAALRPSGAGGEEFVGVLRKAISLGILAAFLSWFTVGAAIQAATSPDGLHGVPGLTVVGVALAFFAAVPAFVLLRMPPDVRGVAVRTLRRDPVVHVRLAAVLAFLAVLAGSMSVGDGPDSPYGETDTSDAVLGLAMLGCAAVAVLAGPVARGLAKVKNRRRRVRR